MVDLSLLAVVQRPHEREVMLVLLLKTDTHELHIDLSSLFAHCLSVVAMICALETQQPQVVVLHMQLSLVVLRPYTVYCLDW